MRVIGIDPGTASVGYGIVDDGGNDPLAVAHGVIVTTPQQSPAERLQVIYAEICKLLAEYRPDEAAVEKLFFGRNTTTAFSVGQARGVILLALANSGLPIAEYTPAKIKESVSGYGSASKQQVQFMVQNLLHLSELPRPDDAADGLAVALTHCQHSRWKGLTADSA